MLNATCLLLREKRLYEIVEVESHQVLVEFEEVSSHTVDHTYYKIVYDKDTKVKYVIMNGNYQSGISPLYNADGTLQLYEK